ncbi:hypothetical protein RFI_17284 [Reticulomyxa filosa]|uniref:Uncharacterized protein n=1 Tax=Reticulomyxa filosa TaxID=46433 RepID=X6N0Z7_RETFI|nr:hypothetical protein RFI_17284 [Reticulomyxa filosa]|eukprot:ETO19935.1 hypothetical protein RFI_17284 [Reticulomyxa filosa]
MYAKDIYFCCLNFSLGCGADDENTAPTREENMDVTPKLEEEWVKKMDLLYNSTRPTAEEQKTRVGILQFLSRACIEYLTNAEETNQASKLYSVMYNNYRHQSDAQILKIPRHLRRVEPVSAQSKKNKLVLVQLDEANNVIRSFKLPTLCLFGSAAIGLDTAGSDIDVAVPAAILENFLFSKNYQFNNNNSNNNNK